MRLLRTIAISALLSLVMVSPARSADAVATGNGGSVALGKNWGPYETFHGSSFRWVQNDAEIVVRGARGQAHVAIACEGGPSLGQSAFPLLVRDATGRQVDHVQCSGPTKPQMLLLPAGDGEARYVMHADGGNRSVPNEKRILNFRVFSLDGGGSTPAGNDIVNPHNGVRLGAHWDPIEHFKGLTFRWLDNNDGQLFVTSNRELDTKLRLLVALGPSVGSPQAAISVRDASGKTLLRTTGKVAQQLLLVPVHLKPGETQFTVAVESQNKPAPGEKRLLNLRVFNIAALR